MDTHDDWVEIVPVHLPDGLLPIAGVAHGDGRVVAQLPLLVVVQRVRGVRNHREVKIYLNDRFFNNDCVWGTWIYMRVHPSHAVSVRILITSQEI